MCKREGRNVQINSFMKFFMELKSAHVQIHFTAQRKNDW